MMNKTIFVTAQCNTAEQLHDVLEWLEDCDVEYDVATSAPPRPTKRRKKSPAQRRKITIAQPTRRGRGHKDPISDTTGLKALDMIDTCKMKYTEIADKLEIGEATVFAIRDGRSFRWKEVRRRWEKTKGRPLRYITNAGIVGGEKSK